MKTRNPAHHTKFRQPATYREAIRPKDDTGAGASGRTSYREEYERDRGPDLDEPLDSTESGNEF
jgi:hypothetical protein